jgi:hypothetical protein
MFIAARLVPLLKYLSDPLNLEKGANWIWPLLGCHGLSHVRLCALVACNYTLIYSNYRLISELSYPTHRAGIYLCCRILLYLTIGLFLGVTSLSLYNSPWYLGALSLSSINYVTESSCSYLFTQSLAGQLTELSSSITIGVGGYHRFFKACLLSTSSVLSLSYQSRQDI